MKKWLALFPHLFPGPRGPRVAIFGGSFNPPHIAHVLAAVYVLSTEPIDAVLVVPVYKHPFSKELASFDDRLDMCRRAFEWIQRVFVSAAERELNGESLTLRTLEHLAMLHPEWSMCLLIGADVVNDLPKWHRFDRIAEIAPPRYLVQTNRDFRTLRGGPVVVVVAFRYRRLPHRMCEFAFFAASARRWLFFSTRGRTCASTRANASGDSRRRIAAHA